MTDWGYTFAGELRVFMRVKCLFRIVFIVNKILCSPKLVLNLPDNETLAIELMKVTVPVEDQQECINYYSPTFITENVMCLDTCSVSLEIFQK